MKANHILIKIAEEFSTAPGPRYVNEGKNSGELFRTELLSPKFKQALLNNQKLIVDLDGTSGYGTSFLEEAFGGLIREDKLSFADIARTLELVSEEDEDYIDEVNEYLEQARDEEQ